jgi:hypothetical protein
MVRIGALTSRCVVCAVPKLEEQWNSVNVNYANDVPKLDSVRISYVVI